MSHFSGHFEGASTFLTPKLSRRFCYDKARELKFAERAVDVYKKTL